MSRRWWTVLVIACLLAVAYPWMVGQSSFLQRMGALVLLYAISASGWNIIGGYGGQISLGHALFFGFGAYGSLLVYHLWQWSPIFGLPVGVGASVVAAIVVGVPTLRLRGHYFTMATIAVAELVLVLVNNTDALGGATGLLGPATPRSSWDLVFTSAVPYYYIFLGVLALTLLATWWLMRSRIGYYLRALSDSERAAMALGVSISKYKLIAFIVSAVITSVAGSLYAIMIGFIGANSAFGILISVQMVLIAALGGAGVLLGPLIGAIILIPLGQFTNNLFGGSGQGITFLIYGGIIVLIAYFQPYGIAAVLPKSWRRQGQG